MAKTFELWVRVEEVRYVPGNPPEYSLRIEDQRTDLRQPMSAVDGSLTVRGDLGVEGDLTKPIKMTLTLDG